MNSSSGNSAPAIGEITAASGKVIAIKPDGTQVILEPGDKVFLNDRVVSENGEPVVITTANNQVLELSGQQPLTLTDSVLSGQGSEADEEQADENQADEGGRDAITEGVDPASVAETPAVEEKASEEPGSEQTESRLAPPDMPVITLESDDQADQDSAVESSEILNANSRSASSNIVQRQQEAERAESEAGSAEPVVVSYQPVAQVSSMVGSEDAPVLQGQLSATDAGGGALTYSLISAPEAGSINIDSDGSFEFKPGAEFDYLAAGENQTVTFVFEVINSQGNKSQASVDITVEGVNDTPEVDAPIALDVNQNDSGISLNLLKNASDTDLNDDLSVTGLRLVSGNEAGVSVAEDGSEVIIDPEAYKYLAIGETETITYEYRVTDSQGDFTIQTASITLAGSNDDPVVQDAILLRADQNSPLQNIDLLAGASDEDQTDTLNVMSLRLTAGDPVGISISEDGNSLSLDSSAYQHLAAGESETVEYSYQVDDGRGGTVNQTASMTIEGLNDAPTITSATDVAGTVSEIMDGDAGENGTSLTDTGSFTIADVDLSDQQSVSVSAGANGYLGSLTATVADDTQGDGSGRIDWSFSVDDADIDYLGVGETLTQTYTVTVDDGEGGTVDQQVTITLTGTNDAPTISSATDVAGMVTEIVDGGAGENSNTLTDNGSFTIADVDLNDQQSVSVSAGANGYLGSLTATVAHDTQGDGSGRIDWSFSVDDADVDYLAAGQTLTQTYTVTVDDGEGGTVNQQVTITLTGTNDAPTISSATDVAGMVTEIVDGGAGENSNTLTDNGSFTIADVDLNDQQSVSVSAGANGYLGSLTATVADDTQGDGSGRIDWSFSVDDADVDYLSAGETLNQTYTVTVDDGKGGTVDQQVTITLTGTNDAPTISSATDVAGMVTEIVDGGAGENSNTLTDNGSFTIADVDLSDQQSVSVSAGANGYLGSLTATVADDTQGDGSGRIDWSFSVDDADVDYLSAGETLNQTYTVTVDDGKGGTVDQQVTITLTGTNDAPTISSATDVAGMVTEIVDGGAGENSNTLTDNGSFTIADVDLNDQQSVSVSAGANGYLGSLTATVADDTQGDGSGRIDWSFSVDDADVDYLSAGETLNQTYTVTVDDGKGGTVDQQVTITLTGTNDAPTISSATDVAGMVTEIVDGGAGENSNTLTDNGSFTIADVDLSDQQSVSVSASANGYLGSLTATVADDTQGDGSGRIDWSFSVDDADVDYLSAGETLNQTYTVTVDDGKGGTVDQQVTITLTGTNDAPTISSATDVAGMVTEIVDGGAGENSNTLTDNGSFTIADVDLNDQQSVSVSAGANGYLGSLTATVADDTQGDGSGRIDWSFSVDDADIDYLGVGETLTQTYTVTVDDGKGGTVDQQVTITLTGTNDAPTISSATDVAGMVTEIVDGGAGENSNTLTDNGSFTIADVDLSDQQSVSVSAGANGYLGSLTATVADDTQGDGSGRIDWSFSVDDADVDYLSAGETLNQTYTVTVDDGKGGTVDQQVTITLTGSNDAPTISSATDVAGMVTEIVDGGAGENSNTLTDNGSFTIADVDLSDQQSVSVSAGANGYLGSLTATVADDTQGDGSGRIDWSFSVDDADVDYLSAGETLNQTYTVTVDDGKGGTVDQQVTITLTGTNDAPTISSATDVAGMVTEIVDGGAGENSNTLTDNGSFTIADVDLSDQQSVIVSAGANGYLGSLTATVADDTQGDGSGRIDWSFSVDDADVDYLSAGETLNQTYTVTVDDGKGGTVDQQVTITLTGTNDAPTISSATDVAGMVTEIVDGGAGENSNTLTDNGSFTIADVDLNDQQSVSVSAGANGYLGSLTATVADDTQGDGSGRIDWSFSVDDADIDYLGVGETLTQTYTVTVDDGKGGTVDQQVTITLTGTNDAPTISSATDVAGMVTEIVDGGAGENSNTLTDNGSFTIADVDLNDQQSVSVSAGANGYLGSLTATVADDTQGDGSGRIDWSFSVDDADIDYLSAGETLNQTYTVTVNDGEGGTVDQQVTITITGTNDAPTITSATDVAGAVTEIVDGGAGENSNSLTDTGSFTIADVDLSDQQTVSVSAGANGYLGSLTATVADDTQGDGNGRIDWSFSVDDADIDYLSAGETLNQTYTVTVNDGEGGTVDQQVTITITGTNDAPTITSATDVAGAVTEIVDGGAGENSNSLTDTGSFTIADVDLSDQQTVSVSAGANGYLGSLTATVVDDTQGDGSGRIDWSFSVDDADIDYLSAGETLNQTYTVTVNDGEGGTVDQQVTITITGTNDAPTITSATDIAGAVTEIVDGGAGENSNSLTDTGSFTIADVDLSDQQTVSVSAGANGYLGSLTATVADDTQGDGNGRIDWSFSVDDADIDYLSAGETLNQTYTVTVNDGEGGTVDQQVTITITGTNDAPTITSATDVAGAVTEIVDGGAGENSNSLTDTGSFTIADVDLSDQQTVSVSAGANGYLGSLTATVADDTQGDGSGRIDWSFSVDDADVDYLSAGETLNQTYTVTVNDGKGGTVDQQVTITLTGTNDAPTISSVTDVAGMVTEIVDGGAGENSNTLTDNGSFTIADVDLNDQQSVSVSAGANGYLGSLTATVADDTQGDGSGRIDWSFSVDDADVDHLAAGQTLTQTYTVTVDDGEGGTVDQQVTITLTGTNDAPTISSATDVAGMVTEIVDGGAGENSNTLTDNGSFTIADVDLNDQQSVSVSAGANGYLGSLTATVVDDTQGDGSGRIDWSFSVDDADIDYLSAGETLNQTYTVTVNDGEGGTVDQQVTITITGTNDAPTITSATDVAGAVTEIVDGGAGENSNSLTDTGSFTIADVDLSDQQTVSVSAGANGYLGSLTATVADDTQGDGNGRIDWSFSVDDADIDYLSAGETLNQTYTVTVNDGEGGTVDQQVTITITGTNDAPTITSATDVAGAVTEIVDGGAGENSNSLTDTGSFTIADVDLSDQQTVSVSAGANGYLGSLTATVADDTQGDGSGRIDWSFSVDDADIDYLSAGETLNQTYTVTVNDGEGGTVDQQVTITITGTNDAPTITSATDVAGAVTEIVDGGAGENSNSLTDTGSFTIADVDLSDQQTVSVSAGANGYLGSLTATVVDDTQGDGSGRIDWSFSVDDADIDYLSAGETLNQTYTVTVNDGEGGTVDQQVTITITGTNDAPTITSATDVAGAVTEIVDGGAGENSNSLTDTGSFTIADVDLSDQQTVSVSAGANGYLGSLTATVADDTQGDGSGRIDWSFSVDDADIDYLSAGETLNQTYTVTVNDGEGGTVDQQVTITITGTNDAPTITSATDVAGAVTEIVDGGAGENSNSLTDTGSFTIADVDLSDQQTVSVSAGANGYLGSLTATVADDTQGDGSGRIDWSFSVDDADIDYLSAGETLNQTYTVTVNDGEGGTVDQQVTITITGTNDAPTITSATDVAGMVTEIVDGGAGENSNTLTDNGSFTIADVDLNDQQTVSVSAGANGYLGSLTATVADDTQGDGSGRIDWSFSVDDADVDYLSAGETLNQTYTVTVDDGKGGTVDQQVTITLTGTNDAPTISSATDVAGMVTEIVDGGVGENSNTLTDNGSFTIADVDLNDQQSVSVSAGANGYLGSLTATVADDTQGDGSGRIDWSFSVDDADVDYLSAGETLNQTYTVTVDDGKGGTVDQQVTITLTGTNDAPTISSATDVAGMVTEIVDGGVGENSNTLTDNGSFTIADVDLNDQQSVSVSAGANGYLGSLTATVADDTQGDGSGRIDWSFSVDDADVDYLSAGETLNQTYTVTVDDGKGGTVDQQVTITITGTNDAPTITSATDVAGAVTEIVDGGAGENSNSLTDTGSFTIADVDFSDQQTVSVSAGANGYLGSLTATVADDTQGDGSGRIDWSFSVNDADIDYLGAGQTLTQTYTVTVNDGEGGTVDQQVTITITGTNDAAVINGTDTGSVTEDAGNILTATGSLSVNDVDNGEGSFTGETITGTYGSLTMNTDGSWSYSADNSQSAIQALGDGDSLNETITVKSLDGTTHDIVITINGTNDAPIAADNNLSLSEAGKHAFTNAEFGFSDVDSGDSLASITLTSLPASGSLTLNGSAVSVNQVISTSDIPNLEFTADASINGSHHGSIGFKVSDGALESSTHTIDFYTPPKIDSVVVDNSFQPVITGTGQPNTTLNFTINNNSFSASVGSDGNWSYTPSLTLNDGDPLNISVTSTEAGGVASSATTYSANVSRGDAQDNTLTGGNGTDFMDGESGADVLTGGEGDDWLTGGSGQDRFVWQAGDGGSAGDPAIDRITDFSVGAGGDILDLHALLSGEENTTADQFIHFRTEGSDTVIDVSVVAGGDVVQQIVLENTDLSPLGNTDQEIIEQLLSDGQLTLAQTIAIDNNIMGDNQISAAEEGAVLVSGVGEPGASIQVEIEDTSAATVSATVTVGLDGTWSLAGSELDVSNLSDGTLDITVTQTDSTGNVTTDTSTVIFSGTTPTLSSAEIVANTQNLVLTFSENMDKSRVPDLADFDVAIDGSAVNVLNVSYLNDTQIRLSLDTAVSPSGGVTLDYTPGSNALQEQVGINPFAALSSFSASVTPDVSAAVRQNMTVEGDQLVIDYNETLDPGSVPDTSAFTLSLVGGGSRTVSSVSISGSRMTLTLDSPVGDADIVQLSYSVADASNNGGGPIQDDQGNDSSSFSSALVENNTDTSVPTINSAVVDGDTLTLTYSEDLNESVSLTGILNVDVAGTSRSVSSTSISGNQVTVQLASPVADGESVTFSYSPSSADSSSNNDRVEDLRGFDAAALNHGDITVTNTTDTISPSLSTAEVDGNTVTLTFSEALNGNATINPSLFNIVVDGQSEPVSSLAISGQQLTLTLSNAITDGQTVTLDYTGPGAGSALDNDRLEDLVGNDTSSIAGFSVDNVTNSGGNPEVVRLYSDDADQWYSDGDTITVKVEFSEPVQVTGNPTLQLETGTIDRLGTYSGGSGTKVLSFTYTVANPDESADLNALSTSALDLGGGTITDLLGNNADLLLPELNEAGALAQQNDIRIDTVSPTVGLSSSSASSAGILTLSGNGFSSLLSPGESTDTDLIGRLDWSKLSWRVVDNSGSNTDISFSAADIESALAVNDQQLNIKISSSKLSSMRATSGYGNEEGMDLIRITSDGFFRDAAGNTMSDGNSAGVEIFILPPDGIAPSVSGITSLTVDGEYATGSVIRLQVSFDEAVEVTGTPVLLMGTGDNISVARFSSGSGTQELVFEYTVQPGDEAPDLDVLSASALQLNGGTIKDLSGNAAVLTVPVAANSDSLASTADIMIDGSAPDVSITGVTLAPEGANDQKLTINGSGFDALLGSGESVGLSLTGDALSRFDWSKLSIKLKQPDGSFESVSLDASDIGSVEIHNNRLEIVIDEGVNKVLDNNGFSTVSGDTALDISQGFMADRAGNRSTTDALADQAVTVTSNGATVLNVSSDTVDGSYQAGDEILIRVRFSEKVSLQNYDPNNDPLLLLLNDRQPTQADPYGGNAVYVSGDGTREFVFRHTVSAGENIDDLNYRDTSSLTFSTGISAGSLVNGAGSNVSLTLPGTASTESLAGSSDIVIDTDAATTTITSAAYDENNNQLLLKGADFDQLLNNSESATADLSGRLDWSKLVIDIDKDDGITQNVSFSASDVTVARLAGADTLSIQLTDAKATELEGIFGYKGSEDGVDIQAGFLRDLAGNEGAAATSDLTLDYTDIAAPTVLQVRLEDPGQFITGEQVVILVQLSESVNISGIDASDASTYPTLNLNNGAVATYDSGAGSDILRFVYTVGAGNSENSQGLNYASDSALTIPAGVMVFDSAGNSMLATLPPVNSNDALAQTGSAIIDVNAPEITAVNSLTSDGPYNEGKVIQIEVSFTEAVDISGVPALNLDTGGQATYSSGAGTDKLVFNYTIGSGQDSSDLDVSSLDLSNGSITDLAGNSVDVSTLPTGAQANSLASNAALEVDTTNPSLPGLGAVNFWVGSDGYSPGRIFIYSDGNQALNSNEVSQMTPDWSKLYVENTETGERHYFKADDFSASSFERHSSINHEMKIDLNQSGADAFEKNFRGYSDWPDTMVVHVEEGFLVDRAGNGYSFSSPSNGLDMEILSPTDTPTAQGRQGNKITDVRVVSVNDTYKAGEELLIQVDFNHVVKLDYSTTPELRFNIGGTQQTAVLDTNAHLSGEYNNSFLYRYTIQSGDNVTGSISLAASNPIDTVFKEPATSSWTNGAITVNSEQSIALTAPSGAGSLDNNSSDLIIDTTAPLTTIASASYDPDTNQLELSGSNFNDILSGNTAADSAELRLVLDWSKLSYKVNGSLTESFSEDDVLSAKVLDNNKLIIELAAAKADSIETNSGGDYSDDSLDISAGFIKDLAGNVSTTDALSAGSVTQSDLKAPDLTSSLASSNELVLGFSEAISGSPSNSDFTVQIDGSARLVTGVAVNGQEVTVTFDGAQIDSSEQLLFSYTGSSLSDSSGNDVASISDRVAGFDHSSSAGLDTLIGDIGDDIFTIDHDDVTASGGLGADIFDFNATGTAQNPAELIITDFNTDEGDVLKLDDILVDPSDSLDEHFHFVASGNDTVMEISDTANGDVTKKVTFKDVDLFALGGSDADILNNLMDNNNLDHGS
ncbi:VCBS domain-containing protein [Endozoicomonas sp. 2B-B]